jgi:hypothetical protein
MEKSFRCTARKGRFVVFKQPWDRLGPYGGVLTLFPERRYRLRLRAHPTMDGQFWYEGFATAIDAKDYARDQALARYPEWPASMPQRWDLWPSQIKLNPLPVQRQNGRSPDLIGEIWLSDRKNRKGGEVMRLYADLQCHDRIAFKGSVVAIESAIKRAA